ncbi:MAG: ZrgA family zinc uptake protein [Henriciella sp.]
MSRTPLFLAASLFAIAACQPAADAPDDLVAETPPPVEEPAVEELVADVESETVAVESAITEGAAEAEAPVEAATEEDHDHGEDHDHEHEDSEHDHAEDAHDHGDDHDHDHDHAGGEAHVHGLSELAATLDGSALSVSIEGALANFDLDESLREIADPAPFATGTVEIIGGDCTQTDSAVGVRPVGDHGNMTIDLTYTCANVDGLEAINVIGFDSFAGFEQVNAVFLTEIGQTAETLTESDTRLDLN